VTDTSSEQYELQRRYFLGVSYERIPWWFALSFNSGHVANIVFIPLKKVMIYVTWLATAVN
jgi:hypothetical protein